MEESWEQWWEDIYGGPEPKDLQDLRCLLRPGLLPTPNLIFMYLCKSLWMENPLKGN